MHPWAQALVTEREGNLHKDDLLVQCLPPGVPRINMSGSRGMPHPFKIVQTPALVVLLYETSANSTFRQVFLDGRLLPKDPQPTWLGYSIGVIDFANPTATSDDTQIVEALFRNPHAEDVRATRRIRVGPRR